MELAYLNGVEPPTAQTVRTLRLAGLLVWLVVGSAALFHGRGAPRAFAVWLACFIGFGAVFAWVSATVAGPSSLVLAAAAESTCVIAMTAVQCRGQEGALLVVVAMQLGLATSPRVGLAAVFAQSLALALAIAHHWSPPPALLLAPPYFGFQVAVFLLTELLSREARGRRELARINAELVSTRELLEQAARVGERLRIARELHDGMGHHLAALSLNLEALGPRGAPVAPALATARLLTRRLLDDVESIVADTRAEHGVDIGAALGALAAAIPRPVVHVAAGELVVPDARRAHAVLRCCQEIVTNAVKHARAENVWLQVRVVGGTVELEAADDGSGAALVAAGRGLEGLRRRIEEIGGRLDVETRPGAGFRVVATLPEAMSA